MTTIIRSDVTLSAPLTGSIILPDLGIKGILHRWHAEAANAAVGANVTQIPDAIGDAHLSVNKGVIKMAQGANGRRYLDMGTAAGSNEAGVPYSRSYESFTLAALYYWDTIPGTSTNVVATTGVGSTSMGLNLLNGSKFGVGTWNSGATSAKSVPQLATPVTGPGWHTVFTAYDKNGDEMAAMDGATHVVRGDGGGTLTNITGFGLRGPDGVHGRIVEACFIDHVLTNTELTLVHERLMAQLPA